MEPTTLAALITSIASIIISLTSRVTSSKCTKQGVDVELTQAQTQPQLQTHETTSTTSK